MTPENDKTLRGSFHKPTIGFTEWNDRRDYRQKYESNSNVLRRNLFDIMSLSQNLIKSTIIHDKYYDFDENRNTNRIFPESKLAKNQFNADTYGYGAYGEKCECCGKQTSCMDFAAKYGLCDVCNNRLEYDSIDLNGNYNNILNAMR